MKTMNRIIITGLVSLVSTGIFSSCSRLGTAQGQPGAATKEQLPVFLGVKVVEKDQAVSITVPGTVLAIESATLFAKVSGYLESIAVDIGELVEAGTSMAVISVPEMAPKLEEAAAELLHRRAQLKQAAAGTRVAMAGVKTAQASVANARGVTPALVAHVDLAKIELKRWKGLVKEAPTIEKRKIDEASYRRNAAEAELAHANLKITAAQVWVEEAKASLLKAQADESAARARVPVAAAQVKYLEKLMDYAVIRAPFRGIVTERYVHAGAFIQSANTNSAPTRLLTIQRLDKVRVSIEVPMDSVAQLNPGDKAVFDNLPALPGRSFEVSVTRIAESLGQRSRMMRAELELTNQFGPKGTPLLRPGYYGDITVYLETYPGIASVPAVSVHRENKKPYVFVLDKGVLRRREIEVMFNNGVTIGVRSGLKAGEIVVMAGSATPVDGLHASVRLPSDPEASK